MLDTIIVLEIQISLKYIPIHIHNFEHEMIQPWLPVSQKYK